KAINQELQKLRHQSEEFAGHNLWDHAAIRYGAFGVSALLTILCITTPFSAITQALFLLSLWGIALLIRHIPGPVVTLVLIVLSITVSSRYLWWRIAYTLSWDKSIDLLWGILLLLAEIYTWTTLVLGYAQTAWPLKRQPTPLPDDTDQWPTVDIFIPTYNEPLKVVKPTIYAAKGLDWPQEKLRIHLLDDGRREEFRLFAQSCGVNYLTRPDNLHAKAGNLNNALKHTSGEFVAIFDCDHMPTRSFLQVSMGGFLKDPKLALVQTPHHFFSPDPFERNLSSFRRVPNEGELFYGLVQDGNDLWNATFFCGSCAILRRAPLDKIGGIAVETVTEDAHTALKLHRLGYTSAYIHIPQAAGLATENLAAHIGQRIRWARGMAQIFRLDNPFFGKGLHWAQRICYSNAMLHFLNGIPRLIFLTAPLAFLIFHAYIIYAPAISVALYVLPHMLHANITASRMQGAYRHSFWAEIYETVLAWYIARPSTVALIDPHRGKFNVTAKGGVLESDFFDWALSLPYLTLILMNFSGYIFGIGRLIWGPSTEIATVTLNLIWTLVNSIILGGAIAVASEAKQVRLSHRVSIKLPAVLHLNNGKRIHCQTDNFSEGGIALDPAAMPALDQGQRVNISLWRGAEEIAFPAEVVSLTASQIRLRWQLQSQEQEAALVQCTFTRADAWISWTDGRQVDQPLESIKEVFLLGIRGYQHLARHSIPFISPAITAVSGLSSWIIGLLPRTPIALTR
ncbi:MAG: UDP-forming cellulose synthase catalytic subunit, partial [Desulfobulbaceae bacterium]|nr:UDP-forming cellulose synthase catalytic subunit [Desulfobulbaceae bacterium]